MPEHRKPTEEEKSIIEQFDTEGIKEDLGQEVGIEKIKPTPPNLYPLMSNT